MSTQKVLGRLVQTHVVQAVEVLVTPGSASPAYRETVVLVVLILTTGAFCAFCVLGRLFM